MQRLREMETEYELQTRRLEDAYAALEQACGDEPDLFSSRWRAAAHAWPLDHLNELIREHNQWYPVEANLAMDPRTRDYVAIHGDSYRRLELGPGWVLEHFPARRHPGVEAPAAPRRVPRERL